MQYLSVQADEVGGVVQHEPDPLQGDVIEAVVGDPQVVHRPAGQREPQAGLQVALLKGEKK